MNPLSDPAAPPQSSAGVAGRDASFESLYRRYARVVHGIVLAHAGPADADDLTQEVFVSVFRRLPSVRDVRALGAWICSVARNQAIDHRRRRGRRPRHQDLERAMEEVEVRNDGDDELGRRVLTLLARLPETYRETLTLRLVEGLTGPEIAERTGMTHGSVRVNLSRGMAMLRPLLQREGWR